jgi:integrase/recombinase XerD
LFLSCIKKAGKEHLETITRGDLGAFVEHGQDRGLKASTVQMRMRAVNAFIRSLIENEVVHPDVLRKRMMIKVPDSLPRAIEPDDEKRLLSVIDDVRDRAMILVLLRTGMRIGELLQTKLGDVNLNEQRIVIFEAEKNRCGRVVYFSDDARDALKAWVRKRDPNKELLFYGMGRQSLTYGGARAMFTRYLRKAGLAHKSYSLHSLRHTNASELLNAGMPLECLKELLGHRCIEMTRRYARLTDKTREEQYFKAMAKIERGEIDGSYRCDCQLSAIHKAEELLSPHREELYEHP